MTLTSPGHTRADVAPLMYALVRIEMIAEGLERCEQRLARYAREEGFELAAVFHERGDGGAFEELHCELVRSQARHVLVPSMEHLSGLPVPRHTLLARLHAIGAWAWPLPDADHATTPSVPGKAGDSTC